MKNYILSLAFCVASFYALSQVHQFEYVRLDQIKAEYKPAFIADRSEIEFNLIKLTNLTDSTVTHGVEAYLISNSDLTNILPLAYANISGIWAPSLNTFAYNLRKQGFIFLTYNDMKTINDFLVIAVAARGREQKHFMTYKLTLNEQMEMGLNYNPDKNDDQWQFFVTIDDALYYTPYPEGLKIMRKLNDYRKRLKKLDAESNKPISGKEI